MQVGHGTEMPAEFVLGVEETFQPMAGIARLAPLDGHERFGQPLMDFGTAAREFLLLAAHFLQFLLPALDHAGLMPELEQSFLRFLQFQLKILRFLLLRRRKSRDGRRQHIVIEFDAKFVFRD